MHNKKDNTSKTHNIIQGLRPLSSSLPHGLKKILRKGGYSFSSIVDNWSKVVGQNISSNCYPSSIKMGKEMNNGTLILNVKENGLENELLKTMQCFQIENFFILDQSFPYLITTINNGEKRCAARLSEYESINSVLSLKDKLPSHVFNAQSWTIL